MIIHIFVSGWAQSSSVVRMKHGLFRHYWWMMIAVAAAVIFWIHSASKDPDLRLTLTVIGSAISGVFFVQKQKLEELKMFKDLFQEFNRRYDEMNEKLNRIADGNLTDELTTDEIKILFDYFNLCGEEYLFFKRGYIDPLAWRAWYNGMTIYYKSPRIKVLWARELKANSYYGLSFRE